MDKIEEEVQEEKEVADLSKPDFTFTPKQTHTWRQEGYGLVCKTCDLEHGIMIGPNKLMIGITDNGTPILKTRQELGKA